MARRSDPPAVSGQTRKRARDKGWALAGKSTLTRLEVPPSAANKTSRDKQVVARPEARDDLRVDLLLEADDPAPDEIMLDGEATDDPVHGQQEGRFFHGSYRGDCSLPLSLFWDEHLVCARLRTADQDGAAGTKAELEHIIERVRLRWPQTRIIVRGDSGVCRDALLTWCEAHDVD